jgi:hypothetical protein
MKINIGEQQKNFPMTVKPRIIDKQAKDKKDNFTKDVIQLPESI